MDIKWNGPLTLLYYESISSNKQTYRLYSNVIGSLCSSLICLFTWVCHNLEAPEHTISRVFHSRFETKSTVISALNQKESINGISVHAS